MKRQKLSALITAAVLVAGLAACGSDDTADTPAGASTASSADTGAVGSSAGESVAAPTADSRAAGGTADSAGASGSEAGSGVAGAAASAAFPVTIESALGEVTIETQPERVVALGWGSQDAALALGVVPVGMPDFSSDSGNSEGVLPWDQDKLAELGAETPELIDPTGDGFPYEQIAALKPDVILAVYSGVTDEEYQRLSQIAPTVGYPDKPWITSWTDQVTLVGQALGRSAEAEQLITATNDLIAAAAADHPEFEGRTIAFGSGTEPGKFNFYYDDDARVELLEQLGFTPAPDVTALDAGDSPSSFAKSVSLELLPDISTDVLVAWYLDDATRQSIEGDGLFQQLSFVTGDSYVPITDPPLVYATSAVNVLSLPWMLDQYLPLLSTAAKNAG